MRTFVTAFVLLFSVGILAWYLFLFDKEITQGEAYGFTIGMQKTDAVNIIKKEYGSVNNTLILSPGLRNNAIKSIKYTNANDITVDDVIHKDVWQMRFDGEDTNVLILIFSESKLIKMNRYRRAFIP